MSYLTEKRPSNLIEHILTIFFIKNMSTGHMTIINILLNNYTILLIDPIPVILNKNI